MPRNDHASCVNLEQAGYDLPQASQSVWEALLTSGAFIRGNFTFASGQHATLKVDAEKLYDHPQQLAIVLGYFATFPCVQDADALAFVPEGMRRFMYAIGDITGKPVVRTKRTPNATSKYDFCFETPADENVARQADMIIIGEDVVTTLGSVAAMRRLFRDDQSIHSIALLRRGHTNPAYQQGLIDHYLVEREIPTGGQEFDIQLEK